MIPILIALLSALSPWGACAGKKSGAILLDESFGARPFALGRAYSALGDDVFGMTYNPAILSRLTESQAAAQMTRSVLDSKLGFIAAATPLSPRQALGLQLAYLDGGEAPVYNSLGVQTASVKVQRDFSASLGYSQASGVGSGRIHVGAAGKVLRSVIAEQETATAYASDVGSLFEAPLRGGLFSVGAAVSNLGTKIGYSGGKASGSSSDPIGLTARFATGFSRNVLRTDRAALAVEADRMIHDETSSVGMGVEYDYRRLCALRVGYRLRDGEQRLTLGIGFGFKDVSFDYGIGLLQSLGSIQQFSLLYRFTIPGIRYGRPVLEGPSALETMALRIEDLIRQGRYFDASSELSRLEVVFPKTREQVRLRLSLARHVEDLLSQGPHHPRSAYAEGFQLFEKELWTQAISKLQVALLRDKQNEEVQRYLRQAQERQKQRQKQDELESQARKATLFEIATKAWEAGDGVSALRIVDEILRLGSYQPALNLRTAIAKAQKRGPRPPGRARRKAPSSAAPPRPEPGPQDQQLAQQLYYEALKDYLNNELDAAFKTLSRARELDPSNEIVGRTFERLRDELQHKRGSTGPLKGGGSP